MRLIISDSHPLVYESKIMGNPEKVHQFDEFCRSITTIPISSAQANADQHYCYYCRCTSQKFSNKLECEIKHRKWKGVVCPGCNSHFNSRKLLSDHNPKCKNRMTINIMPLNRKKIHITEFIGMPTSKGEEILMNYGMDQVI